jgi:hypothetical protein
MHIRESPMNGHAEFTSEKPFSALQNQEQSDGYTEGLVSLLYDVQFLPLAPLNNSFVPQNFSPHSVAVFIQSNYSAGTSIS